MAKNRDWHLVRSTHADVLETLERVIALHPAGSARPRRPAAERDSLAPVVPMRPRLVLVHGDGSAALDDDDFDPNDAA